MILVWLILIPFLGGIVAWLVERWGAAWVRWVALMATGLELVVALALWLSAAGRVSLAPSGPSGPWLLALDRAWVPQAGIRLHLAMDGLSLLLVLLTAFLGVLSVAASWTEITERVGAFHFCLLWVLAGITGVFLALDLFLFYFLWELMLVPMYFLIALWGHENRLYAAVKFFLFTQLSGLLMLLSILGLVVIHARQAGVTTFDYPALLTTALAPRTAMWLMLGFFVAFAVKLPAFPVHTWLPDAHTEAPTAGSVILAGLLLKTGAYGLLRFVLPLFPNASADFAPVAMVLAVIGILYGAILAFAQHDMKRLVAYTSVSHMGFVLLGTYAGTAIALQGVVLQILCHGISTGALFILVGALSERIHTRDMRRMSGFWATIPRMGGVSMLFALAAMGLPGLGNFLAEFLVLLGTYRVAPALTVVASLGLIASTVYALWMMQRAFFGPARENPPLADLSARESVMMVALVAAIVWLGVYPQPVMDLARPTLSGLQRASATVSLPHNGLEVRQ